MMRPSELPAQVIALAEQLFGEARAVLVVGTTLASGARRVTRVQAPSEAVREGTGFDAALVLVDREVQHALGLLRPLLADGAPLLLVSATEVAPLSRLRALLARERATGLQCEALCEAVLLRGLCEPRVHEVPRGWLVVSARMPSQRDALDAFFEQPELLAHR